MKLFIDNVLMEMDEDTSIAISVSVATISQVEVGKTGYSKTVKIPASNHNMTVMGDVDQVLSTLRFNAIPHVARVEIDGCTVMEGTPMLLKCERISSAEAWYHINIIGAGKEWANVASKEMFNEIPIVFQEQITPSMVEQSWTWSKPVKFLPVQRDTFNTNALTLSTPIRSLTFQDYHPFIQAKALLDAIISQSGYTIESNFINSEYFKSIYVSGNYPETDTQPLKDKMNFLAGRFEAATTTANADGRAYADPYKTTNTLGNIVDTADPDAQMGSSKASSVFNTNDCFHRLGLHMAFVPLEDVIVGFEYDLIYTTDYRIKNRSEIVCFDTIYLDDGTERRYRVPNSFTDQKSMFQDRMGYTVMVFDHVASTQYQFCFDKVINPNADLNNLQPGDLQKVVFKNFSTRSTAVMTELNMSVVNPRLEYLVAGEYVPFTGDWALYYEYINETGQVTVHVKARSAAKPTSITYPRHFNNIYFAGADPGMNITIHKETTLKPLFLAHHPAEGVTVNFKQIAAHQVRQIDFVNSIKQMFNLNFYTDSRIKKVYIEPRDSFYVNNVTVDWSNKIDTSKSIEIQELGYDCSKIFTLRYTPEVGGAVARWDVANSQILGKWSATINNRFAKDSENIYTNKLFTPSVNQTDKYLTAKSALLLQVGDRNRSNELNVIENLNFAPKIVRFTGMKELPQGELWSWPSYSNTYPFLAFHNSNSSGSFTLCFENRDGISGLNTYYSSIISQYNEGKYITLYINLSPEDIEPLIIPNSLMHDFRALFKLKINGENILARLEEVCDYNPTATNSTKCVFIKHI